MRPPVQCRVMHTSGRIPSRTVIWAAGVGGIAARKFDRAGRVIVNSDLTVPGPPNLYFISDLASILMEDGKPVPGLAPAARRGHLPRNGSRRRFAILEITRLK